ncbi:MAG: DNA polymerase I, partial [Clostridia bacterium]|nr:DNA polymerase I [Clostridia bacterium]
LNRAFYGIRPLSTKDGRPTNAVYGLLSILTHHLEEINPDYAAVAFDLKAPNFRKQRFPYYKEGRHPTPPDLLAQFADAKEALRYLGFHILEKEGYEADDLLGTVSLMATDDVHCYVLSGDRDLLQLINPYVTVLLASTGETYRMDAAAFEEKYGIPVSSFVWLKALMGDSSDNIPGVPGIGEKTAVKLLQEFGTLEGIFENAETSSLSAGIKAKLAAGKDSAFDSLWLATIDKQVPLGLTLSDLAYHGIQKEALLQKCRDLELYRIIDKLALSPQDRPAPVVSSLQKGFTEGDAASLAALGPAFAVCREENGFSFTDGTTKILYRGSLGQAGFLFTGKRRVVCKDAKSWFYALDEAGLPTDLVLSDVSLYAYVVKTAWGQKDLAALAEEVLSVTFQPGLPGAAVIFALFDALRQKAKEQNALFLAEEVEAPLTRLLFRMEKTGFKADRPALEAYGKALAEKAVALADAVTETVGETFNLNSPKQLSEMLFGKLGLPAKGVRKTQNGYSTDADTLNDLRYAHPVVDMILEYRQVSKLYSTYAVGLTKVMKEDGRIHTDFKQTYTLTGRLSSAEPNLQNIPIRTPLGRELRGCFVPENPDYVLLDADYSQIELRLLAAFSGDENMIRAFSSGEDIHRKTAAAVFGVPLEEVTDDMRKSAKAVNFGIVYGISAFSLAGDLGISQKKAKAYMEGYFAEYPGIRSYLDGVVADAEEKGYTETMFGRRRDIPELASKSYMTKAAGKRVAMNSPIQGSAADVMKIAMINVEKRLLKEGFDARIVMQVHDELIVEVAKEQAEKAALCLKEEMEKAVSLPVRLTAETSIGNSWLTAH